MKKCAFLRLCVLILAAVMVLTLMGCEFELPGRRDPAPEQGLDSMQEMPEISQTISGSAEENFVVIGGEDGLDGELAYGVVDPAGYASDVDEEGYLHFVMVVNREGVARQVETALPANPDGTLKLDCEHQIVRLPSGALILFVDEFSNAFPEESEAGVVTPRYQLPNGDSVDSATVHKTEDGLTYIDYNITYTHYYNASRTYLVDEETYAVVLFTDEFYDPTSPEAATVAHVMFLRWDTDTNYENDILVKEELYRLPDVFLLSKMEFSYSNGANNELALTGGSGLDYDEYYDRYNYVYCEYDSRFDYPKRYPTHYIQYEGDSNRVIVTWYYSYDASGALTWDGTADSDGILRNEDFYEDGVVVKSEDHFPDEGYDIVTEFENGQKKVSYQTFKGHKKHKDGTVHVKYYTDNVATHYDVIDPQGVRLRTVYYDENFDPGRIVYYNKDGSISREEVFD